MKKILLLLQFSVFNFQFSIGQNLVPNPGFETYSALPVGAAQYNLATGWNNCTGGGSPDYFSNLASGIVQLPNCFIGTVSPHSGDGCMGAALWYYSPNDYREYLDIQLTSAMVAGQTYDVSFYITNGVTAGTYGGGGTDNVSVAFSTVPFVQVATQPIPITPQLTYGTIFYSQTWQLMSFTYTADSAYTHLTIGNFQPDALCLYQQFDPCSNYGAYYFFDDISVAASGPPVVNFTASDRHLCPGSCINFTNLSVGATSYQWFFPGGNPDTSTAANPTFICYDSSGNYSVTLIAANSIASDTVTLANLIEVFPQPATPVISQVGNTLEATGGFATYQWYYVSDTITGATDSFYVATQNGNYNLVVTDSNGCAVGVGILNVVVEGDGVKEFNVQGLKFNVFPNPAKDKITVTIFNVQYSIFNIEIYNSLGEKVYTKNSELRTPHSELNISLKDFSAGIYIMCVRMNGEVVSRKFVVEK